MGRERPQWDPCEVAGDDSGPTRGIAARGRVGALVALALVACEERPIADTSLSDVGDPSHGGSCVEIVHEALLPEYRRVLQVAADGPAHTGLWALVVGDSPIDPETEMLFVVRVAGPDEVAVPPTELGLDPQLAQRLRLVPAADAGSAFLWYDAPELEQTILRRFDAGIDATITNSSLSMIPPPEFTSEPERWLREFLLVDGTPYVIAMPPDSWSIDPEGKNLDMIFYVVALNEYLQVTSAWAPLFPSGCNVEDESDNGDCSVVHVEIAAGSGLVSAETGTLTFQRMIRYNDTSVFGTGDGNEPYEAGDLSVLRFRRKASGFEGYVVTIPSVALAPELAEAPMLIDPFETGQDPYAVFIQLGNSLEVANNRGLIRLDTIHDEFDQTLGQPLGVTARLLQLEHEAVLVDTSGSALRAVSLQNPETWGNWEVQTLLEYEGLASVRGAGPGMALLEREDQSSPTLVHISCVGGS